MGWLLGYTLGSIAASFIVVRAFDFLVGGAVDSATSAARGIVFVNTLGCCYSEGWNAGPYKNSTEITPGELNDKKQDRRSY